MEKARPDLSTFFDLPNPGLRAYFQHTVAGNPDDYRPPFWKGMSREAVVRKWQEVVDRLRVKEQWPSLYDYEMEMKSKVGPMSIQAPLKSRIESIEAYYKDYGGQPLAEEAINDTIDFFSKLKGIRLRSLANTANKMRLDTNTGNPWFASKRSRFIRDAIEARVWSSDNQMYTLIHGNEYQIAAILGWRGQEGGIQTDDVKQRVIWMMSLLLNLHELSFYQPAIELVQEHELIPAYVSNECVDRRVTQLFDSKGAGDVVICTDFSKFDQHFNKYMQDAALKVEQGLAHPSCSAWFEDVYPVKFHLPLICSEDLMFRGAHGMGSGSGGTNFDESLAHKVLQFEAARSIGSRLNPNSMAYGDDGILSAPGLSVKDVIRTYTSHGLEMNPEKQYVSKQDCVVLRRWHHVKYRRGGIMVGVYPTFRALGRLLAQERFYDPDEWGPAQVELRAWSILENCNNSPYFEEFVDFCLQGDKYRLGLDLPGFFASLEKTAKKLMNAFPDFLGYTKTLQQSPDEAIRGIKQWRIYKYLSRLRK